MKESHVQDMYTICIVLLHTANVYNIICIYIYIIYMCVHISCKTQKTNLPTNLPTTKTNLKKQVTKCQKLHIVSFHLNLNPPCHRITSRFSTRPDTSRRLTLGHSGSTRHSQNFLEKKSRASFSEALGKSLLVDTWTQMTQRFQLTS